MWKSLNVKFTIKDECSNTFSKDYHWTIETSQKLFEERLSNAFEKASNYNQKNRTIELLEVEILEAETYKAIIVYKINKTKLC